MHAELRRRLCARALRSGRLKRTFSRARSSPRAHIYTEWLSLRRRDRESEREREGLGEEKRRETRKKEEGAKSVAAVARTNCPPVSLHLSFRYGATSACSFISQIIPNPH